MKKLPVVVSLTFLSVFIYLYRSSGKFRKSIASALFAALVTLSWPAQSNAKGVHGFTPVEQSRPARRPGSFSGQSNKNVPGNGNGGDDDNGGKPQYTAPESVQDTNERVERIKEYVRQLEKETDSESEIETESECRLENKAGFKELPDGKNFSYNMEQGRGLKKKAKKVWKNDKAKQEVLRMLNRFDDENANIQEKSLKGFKNLTELKNSRTGPRILIYRGKNEQPTVIGFCMRADLDATLDKLKGKYN
jgi:hypothetical protein